MVGESHDSGSGLKLNLLSRLEGEASLEFPWLVSGANVSSEETLLRDMVAMPSKAPSTGGGCQVEPSLLVENIEL